MSLAAWRFFPRLRRSTSVPPVTMWKDALDFGTDRWDLRSGANCGQRKAATSRCICQIIKGLVAYGQKVGREKLRAKACIPTNGWFYTIKRSNFFHKWKITFPRNYVANRNKWFTLWSEKCFDVNRDRST